MVSKPCQSLFSFPGPRMGRPQRPDPPLNENLCLLDRFGVLPECVKRRAQQTPRAVQQRVILRVDFPTSSFPGTVDRKGGGPNDPAHRLTSVRTSSPRELAMISPSGLFWPAALYCDSGCAESLCDETNFNVSPTVASDLQVSG